MKVLSLLLLIGLVYGQEKYDASNDDFNVAEVLSNERLLHAYSKCLLDKGPCTPEVKGLKEKIPEALATRCAKCTNKQKEIGRQVAKELKTKHPEIWSELKKHYDPQGKYEKAYKDLLND